ncbi:MAG: nucleotidyltransferase family protein [Xenococcus sp. (in: cyanobacteria)]
MKVKNKQDLIKILKNNHNNLNKFGVKRLGLFGSFVRDTANVNSDIDILVVFNKSQKNFNNFMELSFFLEDLLEREIDLVTRESLSPYIKDNILKEVEYV